MNRSTIAIVPWAVIKSVLVEDHSICLSWLLAISSQFAATIQMSQHGKRRRKIGPHFREGEPGVVGGDGDIAHGRNAAAHAVHQPLCTGYDRHF